MLASWVVGAVLALAHFVRAQTPPGVLPIISQNLMVTYAGNIEVNPPGERLQRSDLANPPTFFLPTNSKGRQTALLMMLDLDVPQNNTRATLLHWLAPNMTLTQSSNGTQVTAPADGGAAPYRQPSPPAGDVAHRYVWMLFAQPATFAVPSSFTNVLQTRVPFDYKAFINATRLTTPLAANYITVQNTSTPATPTTFPPDSTAAGGTASGAPSSTSRGKGGGATTTTTSVSSGGSGAASDASAATTTSGGASQTSNAADSQSTGAAANLQESSTRGTMAGAALALLGLLSYIML